MLGPIYTYKMQEGLSGIHVNHCIPIAGTYQAQMYTATT
jgi:hypothetical protein